MEILMQEHGAQNHFVVSGYMLGIVGLLLQHIISKHRHHEVAKSLSSKALISVWRCVLYADFTIAEWHCLANDSWSKYLGSTHGCKHCP